MIKKISVIFLTLFFLGCASAHVYREVMKEGPAFNSRIFSVSPELAYQAVERAVLDKNFMLEKQDVENNFLLAKRSFQKGRRTIALLLQAKISPVGKDESKIFLSAIETKETSYVADRTRFFLWIVPLPGGGGKEASQIKEGEEVVKDKKFYENMFAVIEKEMAVLPREETVAELVREGQEQDKPLMDELIVAPVKEEPEQGETVTQEVGAKPTEI